MRSRHTSFPKKVPEMSYVYRGGLLFVTVVVLVFSACVSLVKVMG
jgi:hypothetical protein